MQIAIQEVNSQGDIEFRDRWGWVDLAVTVAQETGVSFFDIMMKNLVEVLTLATFMVDKVENLKSKHANANQGAS